MPAVFEDLARSRAVARHDRATGGESLPELVRDHAPRLLSRADLSRESGRTFVIVTHDPNVAALAHRQLRMVDGRLDG